MKTCWPSVQTGGISSCLFDTNHLLLLLLLRPVVTAGAEAPGLLLSPPWSPSWIWTPNPSTASSTNCAWTKRLSPSTCKLAVPCPRTPCRHPPPCAPLRRRRSARCCSTPCEGLQPESLFLIIFFTRALYSRLYCSTLSPLPPVFSAPGLQTREISGTFCYSSQCLRLRRLPPSPVVVSHPRPPLPSLARGRDFYGSSRQRRGQCARLTVWLEFFWTLATYLLI